jgi:hypothetical protein
LSLLFYSTSLHRSRYSRSPFALIFLFLGFVTLDAAVLGRPGLFFIAALDKIAPYLLDLDISVSLLAMMRLVSMPPLSA